MLFRQANVCFLPQRFCDGYLVHKAHTGDKVAARWISIGRSHNPAGRNQPACFGVEWKGLPRALRDLGIALVGTVFIGLILARFLPKTSLFQKLVSQTASGVNSVAAQEAQRLGFKTGLPRRFADGGMGYAGHHRHLSGGGFDNHFDDSFPLLPG